MKLSNIENCWGIIGCGWLGLAFAKKVIRQGNKVIGSTTSQEKLDTLRKAGILPVLFSAGNSVKQYDDFKSCNYILLNIPPSSLKENYAAAMLDICNHISLESKVIFISSTSVYADKNQTASEIDALDGDGRNAAYIIEAENKLKQALKERLTIIRMAGLVGGERHPAKFMSSKKYDHGKNKVNLIHLDDCIGLVDKVAQEDYFGEIINGCSSEHPTKMDYYTWAAEQMKITPPSFNQEEGRWKKISNNKSISSLNYNYKYASPYEFPL